MSMAGTPAAADALDICARAPLDTPPKPPTPAAAITPPPCSTCRRDGEWQLAHSMGIVMTLTSRAGCGPFAGSPSAGRLATGVGLVKVGIVSRATVRQRWPMLCDE